MHDRPRYGVRKSAAIPDADTLRKILPKGCEISTQHAPNASRGELEFKNLFGQLVFCVIGPKGMDQARLNQLMAHAEGARNTEFMKERAKIDEQTQVQEPGMAQSRKRG